MHEQTSDKKPDNWKMGRAEGPSFCNFYFNLVLRFLEKIAEFPCTGGTILSEPIGEIPKEFEKMRCHWDITMTSGATNLGLSKTLDHPHYISSVFSPSDHLVNF